MFYYAGQTVSMHDPETGKVIQAQIFITILGASNYIFVKATLFQSLPHWIKSHIHGEIGDVRSEGQEGRP